MIIENLSLDLGITSKGIFRYVKERLYSLGERGDVDIVDIDMNPFSNNVSNKTVSLQVSDIFMVSRLKRLDGILCLGETLRVRKINEETT